MVADHLSGHCLVIPAEWLLLPQVFNEICKVCGKPIVNRNQKKLKAASLCVSSSRSHVIEEGYLPSPMEPFGTLEAYTFPQFAIITVPNKVMTSDGLTMVLVAPLWPQKEWYVTIHSLYT